MLSGGLSICPDLSFKAIRRRFKALEKQKVYHGIGWVFRIDFRYLLERLKEGRPISRTLGESAQISCDPVGCRGSYRQITDTKKGKKQTLNPFFCDLILVGTVTSHSTHQKPYH